MRIYNTSKLCSRSLSDVEQFSAPFLGGGETAWRRKPAVTVQGVQSSSDPIRGKFQLALRIILSYSESSRFMSVRRWVSEPMPIKGTACTTPNFQVRERLISHVCRDAWHWWGASVCVHRSVSVSPALRCHCATCFTSSSGASVLLSACSTAAGQNVGLLHISYSKCSCERCGIYWDCNYFREMYQVFMQEDFFLSPNPSRNQHLSHPSWETELYSCFNPGLNVLSSSVSYCCCTWSRKKHPLL